MGHCRCSPIVVQHPRTEVHVADPPSLGFSDASMRQWCLHGARYGRTMSPFKDPLRAKAIESFRVLISVDAGKYDVFTHCRLCVYNLVFWYEDVRTVVDDFEVDTWQHVLGPKCFSSQLCPRSEGVFCWVIQVWWLQADGCPVHVELLRR